MKDYKSGLRMKPHVGGYYPSATVYTFTRTSDGLSPGGKKTKTIFQAAWRYHVRTLSAREQDQGQRRELNVTTSASGAYLAGLKSDMIIDLGTGEEYKIVGIENVEMRNYQHILDLVEYNAEA